MGYGLWVMGFGFWVLGFGYWVLGLGCFCYEKKSIDKGFERQK